MSKQYTMKKFILLTTTAFFFSCATSDIQEESNMIQEIERLESPAENPSDKTNPSARKDTDNDGIHDAADADVNGDGIIDNGTDNDGDGVNDIADVDNDNDGVDDNGTDIDEDGINDEHDDDIDGDGIYNDDDEYRNLSDTSLSATVQEKITAYIQTNYAGETITEVEIESQGIEIELTGDVELYFDLNGDFLAFENDYDDDDNDENEYNSLSSSNLSEAVQQKITTYVNSNFPNQTIVEVEVENQEIEIELSNDVELIFDLNGNFLKLDN